MCSHTLNGVCLFVLTVARCRGELWWGFFFTANRLLWRVAGGCDLEEHGAMGKVRGGRLWERRKGYRSLLAETGTVW